ncbi:MAG TPA: glycine oxidase ThiO [Pyrinomonadaceae bacterium]
MNVIIVGGGVIGLSIARELKTRGVEKIVIFDKGAPGREASWAAAGILAPQVEADEADNFFRLCFESNSMYPRFADELVDETGIDIELNQTGTLFVGFDDRDSAEIEKRVAWQTAAGLEVQRLDPRETLKFEPDLSPHIRESLLFPHDGQVENRKLVEALVRYAAMNGIRIVDNADVQRIVINDGMATGVMTRTQTYSADVVILTAGAWTAFIKVGATVLPIQMKPIRGQMICYRPPSQVCSHVVYSRRGYLVPRADGRLLVGATAEDVGFDKSNTQAALECLRETGAEMAPAISDFSIDDQWAGLRPYAEGGRPVIGGAPFVDRLFVATGHFRNGILLTPITARLIADAVTGKPNEFLDRFGFPEAEQRQITGYS